jgi:hypothetical protein
VRVDLTHFEKANVGTKKSHFRIRAETGRFQAMGQLHSTCTAPPRYGNSNTRAESMTHPSSQSPVMLMYLCSIAER